MNFSPYLKKGLLHLKVIPNSSKEDLIETYSGLKLYLKAVPEKGKANQAIIKFFKKRYQLNVTIISGEKSREKVLQLF